MNFKLRISIFIAIFVILIAAVSSLDSDRETLSKARAAIVVNQVGYLPQWQKTAFIVNNQNSNINPQLINYDTRKLVTTLTLGQKIRDEETRDVIFPVDFTDLTQPGTYYLKQDKLKSVPFQIGADIYQEPLVSLTRSYYQQRCGVEVDDPITGISHEPCHIQDGLIARQDRYHEANEQIEALGGWHNGEGYSKYIATTTVTIARLLSLYQKYSNLFPDNHLNIPESGNGVSDLLDEMRFGLDWLLKMQRVDGAVYRKLAGENWPLNLSPDEDIQPRYIYGISTAETAKFAAVMAIASQNYQSVDVQLAARYLEAAELAWQYLQTQPEMKIDWLEKDDLGSLKYIYTKPDREASLQDIEDRLWAAVELYIATGKQDFNQYFAANLDRADYDGIFGWKNPLSLALTDYLEQSSQPSSEELTAQIKTKIQQQADIILNRVKQSSYNIANDRFIEGSNRMTIEEGITLVYAYQLTKNQAYLTAAIDQLNYILGRNHFNQTFVTGIGTNPVKHINHLFAIAKKVYLPGLLVGGPNRGDVEDGTVVRGRGQLSYSDDARSYNSNQYTIDNNASLISLITNLIVQE